MTGRHMPGVTISQGCPQQNWPWMVWRRSWRHPGDGTEHDKLVARIFSNIWPWAARRRAADGTITHDGDFARGQFCAGAAVAPCRRGQQAYLAGSLAAVKYSLAQH